MSRACATGSRRLQISNRKARTVLARRVSTDIRTKPCESGRGLGSRNQKACRRDAFLQDPYAKPCETEAASGLENSNGVVETALCKAETTTSLRQGPHRPRQPHGPGRTGQDTRASLPSCRKTSSEIGATRAMPATRTRPHGPRHGPTCTHVARHQDIR